MSLHCTLGASHIRAQRAFTILPAQRAMQAEVLGLAAGLKPGSLGTIPQNVAAALLPIHPVLYPSASITIFQSVTDLNCWIHGLGLSESLLESVISRLSYHLSKQGALPNLSTQAFTCFCSPSRGTPDPRVNLRWAPAATLPTCRFFLHTGCSCSSSTFCGSPLDDASSQRLSALQTNLSESTVSHTHKC